MRLTALVVLLSLLGACDAQPLAQSCPPPVAAQTGSWPNEPAGFKPVSAREWKCEGVAQVSDELVFTYPPGFQSGYAPGVAYLDLAAPAPEVYFGFRWTPSREWESHSSGVNKIALLFPSTSAGGTIYIMMFYDRGRYTIQVETTFERDTRRLEPNLATTPVVLGEEHQIEWYVRYSSNPSSRDGVVRWWLDGVKQGEYTDLQMPPDAGFTQFTIRPVWGGGVGETKKHTDSFSYGRVHASVR